MPRKHRPIEKGPCKHCGSPICRPRFSKFCCSECCYKHALKPVTPRPIEDRFWAKVMRGEEHDCWPWREQRYKRGGYGKFVIPNGKAGGRKVYAHRFAYESLRGRIPAFLRVDHMCRNKLCQNPSHMQLLTNSDHTRLEWDRKKMSAQIFLDT